MKTVKIFVVGAQLITLENCPDNATVQYAIERGQSEHGVNLVGTYRVGGVDATLDTQVSDGGIIIVSPSEKKLAGATEEVVLVDLVIRKEIKLLDQWAFLDTNTVGDLARLTGVPACGSQIFLNGVEVGFADTLQNGTYEVKQVPCGDDEDLEDEDEEYDD